MSVLLYYAALTGQMPDSSCPPPGFRLYDVVRGVELARADPDDRSFDLAALGLPPGRYTLSVTAVDAFGTESEGRQIEVVIGDAGAVFVELVGVQQARAQARAAGGVRLTWLSFQNSGQPQLPAAEFEVARGATGPATTVAVVEGTGSTEYRLDLAPATHGVVDGERVRLWVRASDGVVGGQRSAWVDAGSVLVDGTGPPTPVLLQGARPQC